ncbi:starch-binding protein [Catenovulum sp. 2E275]|uniref:starch-binding protein n=1 Tax=Catenovulum sp. 2E275 TaxID=2980497 RepID=UPI0021D1D121|nr:starch-binding protein [Catenovulum sp. 2E275]MCU4676055.1 starch-binding protein [Catenovulum sp. 2E275]
METRNIKRAAHKNNRCSLYAYSLFFVCTLLGNGSSLAAVNSTSICFDNNQNYQNPTVYLWNVQPQGVFANSQWPGQTMSAEGDYYCYDTQAEFSSVNVIFNNNGAPQTADLYATAGNTCYQNNAWTSLESCGLIQTNQAPVANAGADITITEGQSAQFDASASTDSDGSIVSYQWDNGLTGVQPTLVYDTQGTYTVNLIVTDDQGATSTDTVTVTVEADDSNTGSGTIVCYDNSYNHAQPTIYAWGAVPANTVGDFGWPGEPMQATDTGFVCYDFGLELTSINVIFTSNGGNQSPDLTATEPTTCYKNNTWVTLAECGMGGEVSTSNTLYYVNNAGLNPVTAHIWDVEPASALADTQWPGLELSQLDDSNIWYVDLPESVVGANIIFSQNGTNQTADLTFSNYATCYNNGTWMSAEACGIEPQVLVEAGPDRKANQNSKLALSAAASEGDTSSAVWTSDAWSGELTGASVVTPELVEQGTFTVTLTLANGETDSFELGVVAATQAMPERPLLAAELNFPLAGNVSGGNYEFEPAFPALNGLFSSPVMVTNDGTNDLVYVVDKKGTLSVFPNDKNVSVAQVNVILDITAEVRDYHEQGLLSVAFHPDFATNGYAYIYYIEGDNDNESDNGVFGDAVLERIKLNDTYLPTDVIERVEVLRIAQPGPDHKGGMMAFHPSTGEFYLGVGDGAYGDTAIEPTPPDTRTNNGAQDTSNLLGSFIRLEMRETPNDQGLYYDIPTDNPYVDNPNIRDEIWSYGHRNPWRWSFDKVLPYTLWETEVGQAGFEEVNIINAGQNYGWPICEGTNHRGNDGGDPNQTRSCENDLTAPVGGYYHNTGSVSIIGGFVYRGTQLPGLTGKFIYGDYVSKKIWSANEDETDVLVSAAFPSNISSFGTDLAGEKVYISTHGAEYNGLSTIYRMIDSDVQAAVIPEKLSETGLFADLTNRIPSHGVIEYDVNSDGWFDGLQARHFIAVPNAQKIEFNEANLWDLPVGSVLVKHLELPISATETRGFETSVLFKQTSGNWASANYYWDASGTDATLVNEAITVNVDQFFAGAILNHDRQVRSGNECTACHIGTGSKEPLAITTGQLNKSFDYQGVQSNQLDAFNEIGLFTLDIGFGVNHQRLADPQDAADSLPERASAYFETNCSHCHNGSFMDLNYDTPLAERDIMNVKRGEMYRMAPFDHESSLIYTYQIDDANRMPKGTKLTNPVAEGVFRLWIDGTYASQLAMSVRAVKTVLGVGETLPVNAYALYDNDFEAIVSSDVVWTSSDESVLQVSGVQGDANLTAVSTGTVTVTASSQGFSGTLEVTVEAGPDAVTNLAASAESEDTIALSWTDNASNETHYLIKRSETENGSYQLVKTLAANSQAYVDTGLEAETQYFYQVVAKGQNANSEAVTVSAVTTAAAPIDGLSIVSRAEISLIAGETTQVVAIAQKQDELIGVSVPATWQSADPNIATVSDKGQILAGNTAGVTQVSVTYQGLTASVEVENLGAGQYIYFKNSASWATPTAYMWRNEGGVETTVSAAWPGSPITLTAPELGANWFKIYAPYTYANSNGDLNIIFSDSGANQTADDIAAVNIMSANWFDAQWLTSQPEGNGVETGTQVQIGNGEITLTGSANLSGKLFTLGTVLDISANGAATGLEFSHWEGTGVAYLVDSTKETTQMVVGDGLSFTLLAVYDSVSDEHLTGRQYYTDTGCTGCHGYEGNTGTSLLGLANTYSLEQLTNYIETNMPLGNSAACTGECASTTAAMILDEAFTAPANVCSVDSLDDIVPQDRGYRLLTTLEYNNSIRDLLGLGSDVDVTTGRVPADIPLNGFFTNANTVFTNDYAKGYITSAEAAAEMVSDMYSLTTGCSEVACFLDDFAKRAFRRPLTTTEKVSLTSVYNDQGELALLTSILSAPAMLYRSEVGEPTNDGYYQLTDYEVATLLAYTYWATTPDNWLLAKADAGELSSKSQISNTVSTMLQSDKAKLAFERFISGWLNLDRDIKPNELSDSLKADMRQETIEFVSRIVFNGGDYNELLTAQYSYMTEQLALHYGFEWPGGTGWQRVDYDPEESNGERAGLLGHASILAINSAGEKTHPVKRGLFVRRNLMCQDFPPPPVGAELKPQEDPSLTVRERFEHAHLQEGCESCHQYIDGIGFGFENYNSLGKYVTTETTDDGLVKAINSAGYIGSLNSAETFLSASEAVVEYQGINELAELVADSKHGKACYARQWFRYARGSHEESVDACTLQVFGDSFKNGSHTSLLDLMIQYTQTSNYILRK